jgi:hypothetical protein
LTLLSITISFISQISKPKAFFIKANGWMRVNEDFHLSRKTAYSEAALFNVKNKNKTGRCSVS